MDIGTDTPTGATTSHTIYTSPQRRWEASVEFTRELGEVNDTVSIRVEGDDRDAIEGAVSNLAKLVMAWRDSGEF